MRYLRTHARQVAVREGGLDLVVIDYLQLMRADPPSGAPGARPRDDPRGRRRLACTSRRPRRRLRSATQVAGLLLVDRQTVVAMIDRGELAGVKVGKQWRIAPEDVWPLDSRGCAVAVAGRAVTSGGVTGSARAGF